MQELAVVAERTATTATPVIVNEVAPARRVTQTRRDVAETGTGIVDVLKVRRDMIVSSAIYQ